MPALLIKISKRGSAVNNNNNNKERKEMMLRIMYTKLQIFKNLSIISLIICNEFMCINKKFTRNNKQTKTTCFSKIFFQEYLPGEYNARVSLNGSQIMAVLTIA